MWAITNLSAQIVDFVVWLLFSRDIQVGKRPKHILCDGFRRSAGPGDQGTSSIPGLFSLYPNSHVKALREAPWPQLLALLGKSGEKIMIGLLVDTSIYVAVEAGFNNYHQLTGRIHTLPVKYQSDLSRHTACRS